MAGSTDGITSSRQHDENLLKCQLLIFLDVVKKDVKDGETRIWSLSPQSISAIRNDFRSASSMRWRLFEPLIEASSLFGVNYSNSTGLRFADSRRFSLPEAFCRFSFSSSLGAPSNPPRTTQKSYLDATFFLWLWSFLSFVCVGAGPETKKATTKRRFGGLSQQKTTKKEFLGARSAYLMSHQGEGVLVSLSFHLFCWIDLSFEGMSRTRSDWVR